MKEENRKYAELAYDIVKHASEKIGSRLPGTENERKFAAYMGEKLRDIGIEPVKEEFFVSPRANIGGLSYAGWFGLVISGLVYLALGINSLWFGMGIASVLMIFWLIFGVFLYKKWFDLFFHREISQNTYGELTPADGKYDYTIILSGHTDTCWTWRHSENLYKYRDKPLLGLILTYGKVGFGAVCVFFICGVAAAMAVILTGYYAGAQWAMMTIASASFQNFTFALHFLPVVTAIGSCFIIMWDDPNPQNASRGAMDNATGCALSYTVMQYFKEHPEKMPKNCRIIDLNCGCEEVGLRGSMAFAEEHKNDDMLKNAWNINIDSVADKEYFEVVVQDDWQMLHFDTDLEEMFVETIDELGLESKMGRSIHNPVGGCDSTPMTRAGIKSVTFAAQNPMLTYYYHTWRDTADRFTAETVGDGFEVVLSVIDKIAAFQEKNGYNGPQTKAKKKKKS